MTISTNPDTAKVVTLKPIDCPLCGSARYVAIASGHDYEYWTTEQAYTMVRCGECDHVYLNPQPTPDSAAIMYPHDYYTLSGRHSSSSSRVIARMKRRIIRGRLAAFESLFQGAPSVLEIGCGDCTLLTDIRGRCPRASVSGVDIAFPSHVWDQRDSLGLTLIKGRIEDVELPNDAYDLVILNQVIEHLWTPIEVMRKIARALKPGGYVSIETNNIDGYDRRFFAGGKWGGYYFPRHLNLFSFDTMRRMAEHAGLHVTGQYSLLAPIVWTFSVHAWLCPTPQRSRGKLGRFLSDRNPLCLAVFTLVDLVALALGWKTSNQKAILTKS